MTTSSRMLHALHATERPDPDHATVPSTSNHLQPSSIFSRKFHILLPPGVRPIIMLMMLFFENFLHCLPALPPSPPLSFSFSLTVCLLFFMPCFILFYFMALWPFISYFLRILFPFLLPVGAIKVCFCLCLSSLDLDQELELELKLEPLLLDRFRFLFLEFGVRGSGLDSRERPTLSVT